MPKNPAQNTPPGLSLTFAAQIIDPATQPQADDASAAPGQPPVVRFTGIAYSGGIVPSYGWQGDVAIDLAELQNPNGHELPVLVDHCTRIESIAGKGRITRVLGAQGAELHITGELTTATESGQCIANLMREGYPLQMSVGMNADLREIKPGAGPTTINGQTLEVAAVFERPLIREVSFVAVGADPSTTVSQLSATLAQFTQKGSPPMSRTPEDQTLIETLQAETASLQTQITDMQTAQAEQAKAQRSADLSALFTELGRDAPADLKPYIAMSAEGFAAYAADLRTASKATRKIDSALFSSQAQQRAATAGTAPAQSMAATSLFAAVARHAGKAHA